jgi:hypothetical protein
MAKRSGDRRVSVRVADHRARLRGEAELAAVCQAIEAYPGAADDQAFVYALAEDDQ